MSQAVGNCRKVRAVSGLLLSSSSEHAAHSRHAERDRFLAAWHGHTMHADTYNLNQQLGTTL